MNKQRRQLSVAPSCEKDNAPPPSSPPPPPSPPPRSSSNDDKEERSNNKRKTRNWYKSMELELEVADEETVEKKKKAKKKAAAEEERIENKIKIRKWRKSLRKKSVEEDQMEDAKPLGEPIGVSGSRRWKKLMYKAFEFESIRYELEDTVLFNAIGGPLDPYVAIIKEISMDTKKDLRIKHQRLYRPEEAGKISGDSRERFYSFHQDECPPESVLHKCVVHFIPLNKEIPKRKEHPGFIVQKVYDIEGKRLLGLKDNEYEESKQAEIDLLVQKTIQRIGDLPDLKRKHILRRESMLALECSKEEPVPALELGDPLKPLEISREDEGGSKSKNSVISGGQGSCSSDIVSEYYKILEEFNVLTYEKSRDKWIEKLLEGFEYGCTFQDKNLEDDVSFIWPDRAVQAAIALEDAAFQSIKDPQNYTKKMRRMVYNIRINTVLSRRFLNAELEPLKLLNMSAPEIEVWLQGEENLTRPPKELENIQMSDDQFALH